MMGEDERSNRAGTETWRLFVAVPMPLPVREIMRYVEVQLKAYDWPVRWVDPNLAHMTLKFLGDTRSDVVPALEAGLRRVAAQNSATSMSVGAVGAFSSMNRARVIWLGLNGDVRPLEALAGDVNRAVSGAGFSSDERPFRPHITLGRVRQGKAMPNNIAAVIERLAVPRAVVSVDRVRLVRSVLSQSGPTYTTLAEWPLGSSAVEDVAHPVELVEHG